MRNFGDLDISNILEQYATHVDRLRPVVVVEVVGAVALLLPTAVALDRTGSLHNQILTSPQAAQMAWSLSWPRGFPQMHLSPLRGSSMR